MRKKLELKPLSKSIDAIAKENSNPNIITQSRRYKLITPLFGGGVEPGVNDDLTPISGKAIRGQLRFWWRSTRGVGTIDEMKKREDAIWGTTEKASAIIIEVLEVKSDEKDQEFAFTVERNKKNKLQVTTSKRIPQYVAYPLLPDKNERKQECWKSKKLWYGVEFTFRLKYPKEVEIKQNRKIVARILLDPEVNAALWAWETFGGVGARTRRGFGALQLIEVNGAEIKPPTIEEFKNSIRTKLKVSLVEGTRDGRVPHLLADSVISFTRGYEKSNCVMAWQDLIHGLQNFRQSPRVQSKKIFSGRSHWPEPDAIRRMTTNAEFRKPEHPIEKKFPRAIFGLPIGFKFKDEDKKDPPETFLEGREKSGNKEAISRLASPLILRPIACSDGAIGLALVLQSQRTPPDGVYLYYKSTRRKVEDNEVEIRLTRTEAANVLPVANQLEELDKISTDDQDLVLKAFLNYLAKG